MAKIPSSATEIHAIMRRPGPTAIIAGSVLLFSVLPALPEVRRLVGVDVAVTLPLAMTFALLTIGASILFHRDRHSRAYLWCNRFETAATTIGCVVPIILSGQPTSIFWFLFLAVSLHAGTSGSDPKLNVVLVTAAPVIVVGYFVAVHNPGGALAALCIGGIGIYTYATLSVAARRLGETIEERDRLAAALGELQLQAERARIARDLHDGVGAELAALIWRARRLQAELDRAGGGGELRALEERVYAGVDELRAIVWALRSAPLPVIEWLRQVEDRCREMCGDALTLRWDCAADAIGAMPATLQQPLARMIWECVRNAVRHARAQTVAVALSATADAMHLTVEDDGLGIPEARRDSKGGLANLAHRAAELGGTFTVSPARPGGGTRVTIVVPLVAAAHGKSTA